MLFSSAVLLHVHPDDLAEYVGNILTIIGSTGQAIIDAHLNEDETVGLQREELGTRGACLGEDDYRYGG